MSSVASAYSAPLRQIVIYAGHKTHPLFGPYAGSVEKKAEMFEYMNRYRQIPWEIETVDGDDLEECLRRKNPEETLLVIPAGQSSRLDRVFTAVQTAFLRDEFFVRGGRGFFICGSAYWVSEKRIFKDLCEESPEVKRPLFKSSSLPLFYGVAEGPLCPFPGKKYKVGFYSDAMQVTDGVNQCSIYLSGGGSFIIPEMLENGERVSVLLRYLPSELTRHGILEKEIPKWENAAIMTSVGKGAALLSMFHPYFGPDDIAETHKDDFPDCGTDWDRVKAALTPLEARMQFIYQSMVSRLENRDF